MSKGKLKHDEVQHVEGAKQQKDVFKKYLNMTDWISI